MAADFADRASRTERKEVELVPLIVAAVHLEVSGIGALVQVGIEALVQVGIVEVKANFGIGERGADHSVA